MTVIHKEGKYLLKVSVFINKINYKTLYNDKH